MQKIFDAYMIGVADEDEIQKVRLKWTLWLIFQNTAKTVIFNKHTAHIQLRPIVR